MIPPACKNKSAGPSAQFGMPAIGSFACKKNKSKMSKAPTKEFVNIKSIAFLASFRNKKLCLKQLAISFQTLKFCGNGESLISTKPASKAS